MALRICQFMVFMDILGKKKDLIKLIEQTRAQDIEKKQTRIERTQKDAWEAVCACLGNKLAYTAEDIAFFLKKCYHAEKIQLGECQTYACEWQDFQEDISWWAELAEKSSEEQETQFFLLPALCERSGTLMGKKNACIVCLRIEQAMLSSYALYGNKIGYNPLQTQLHMIIQQNKKEKKQ